MVANNIYLDKIQDYKNIFTYCDYIQKDWSNIFSQESPLIIDLGCGAGQYLLEKASNFPNYNYIGIETRFKRLVKAAKKLQKNFISNVFLLQRKVVLLSEFFQPELIEGIIINFPDPWQKKRQQKHRLITTAFLNDVASILKKNGSLSLKTDHCDYFLSVKKLIEKIPFFILSEYSENLQKSVYQKNNLKTEFENIFLDKGLPIYYLKIIKI